MVKVNKLKKNKTRRSVYDSITPLSCLLTELFLISDSDNIPKDCESLRERGWPSGEYMIDIDGSTGGLPPFRIFCDMDTIPATIVVRNALANGTLVETNIVKDIQIHYELDSHQIQGLISSSDRCVQSLTYMCSNSPLTGKVHWTDKDNTPVNYWTSGIDNIMCNCGVYNACRTAGRSCLISSTTDKVQMRTNSNTDVLANNVKIECGNSTTYQCKKRK